MTPTIKTITVNSINTEIEKMKLVKNTLEIFMMRNPQSIQEEIFLKYIEFQNAAAVASYFNDAGYRLKCDNGRMERKYISNDITALLNNSYDVSFGSKALYLLAKNLYYFYKGKVRWNYIVKICEDIMI